MIAGFRIKVVVVSAAIAVFAAMPFSKSAAQSCSHIQLSENGKAIAKIVVAENADKAARFGALDLKWHLDRITGGTFEIVTDTQLEKSRADKLPVLLCVGPSRFAAVDVTSFANQEFAVMAGNGRIVLAGPDMPDKGRLIYENDGVNVVLKGHPLFYHSQGSMYAVYDFLQKECAVVWADMSDLGTYLPHEPNLRVSVKNRRLKPFIAYRGGTIDYPKFGQNKYSLLFWKENTKEFEECQRLMYANTNSIAARSVLFRLRHRIGGREARANHSFLHYYDKYWDETSAKFIRKRPEIFAKGYGSKKPPQMCYSSKEFIDLVIADVRAYFDQDSKKGRFAWGRENYSLAQMDNSFYCKCDACQSQMEPEREVDKASDSTYWFRFVKTVAEEIRKTHPDKQISTLAYHSHEGLPRGFMLPDNVVVYFCLSANREPYRSRFKPQLERMLQWRKAYPKQPIAMWLYNTYPLEQTNNSGFNCFPGFFAHEAARQYRFFHKNNFSAGIFQCGMNGDVDTYMQFEWMVDPTRDPDVMLDEFFKTYGRAGEPLKKYYRLVENRYCDFKRYPKSDSKQTAVLAWGGAEMPQLMKSLGELVEEAERLAETPAEKRRVALWKLGVWEYMKEGYTTFLRRQESSKPKWKARRVRAAKGDLSKINFAEIPAERFTLYNAGSDVPSQFSGEVRLAHDGDWLYLELRQFVDTARLKCSPGIFPSDTWEIFVARQEALPYRHYASSPDGKIVAMSNGEINGRMNVPATESGVDAFGVRVASDTSKARVWKQRFAFPLKSFTDAPVVPGERVFINCVRVVNEDLTEGKGSKILAITKGTTVHTTDRMGMVTIEK